LGLKLVFGGGSWRCGLKRVEGDDPVWRPAPVNGISIAMELVRHDGVDAFYRRAESFLVAHEAKNNLLLGLCASLSESPALYDEPPYLVTIEHEGAVVAVALRTPPHNLVLSAAPPAAPPAAIDLIVRDLHGAGGLPGVLGPAADARAFASTWQALAGGGIGEIIAERIYQLEAVVPVVGVRGGLERATPADRDLVVDWAVRFTVEAIGPADRARLERTVDARLADGITGFYLWRVDGAATSLAGCQGPTPTGIRIGPVYTPPDLRKNGYASACVAALSQRLLDDGRRRCFLFTNLANPTANAIYQAIGYQPVCDVARIEFATAEDASGGVADTPTR
jgi:predicted GNAT family acetyltransferase